MLLIKLLFTDEDESSNLLLNSEGSNQSLREKIERDEMGEICRREDPHYSDVSIQLEYQSLHGMNQEERARKLIEAHERRERARRFASFTSWVQDLHRVWAPKQPKSMKPKSDPFKKRLKRKEQRKASNDTVCETPMTGKKWSRSRGNSSSNKMCQDQWTASCGSVSEALFRDDCCYKLVQQLFMYTDNGFYKE